ncbi:MAG: glycosyltransferase family 2 protein [Burkholderiaceae bacterium]|nr:glycosyltransferase family 2 protein [Burkholderiaceae bacterium]
MKKPELEVTVVICTRNRARQLASVLESAAAMSVPEGLQWEFLLVDNGSTDDTTEVAMGFADRLPMRVVREDTPGLSNARNKGVEQARGRYMCWTDDDVVIDPGWLAAYVQGFRMHPDAAVFGGKVIPLLEGGNAPDWFERGKFQQPLSSLLAYRDLGEVAIPLGFSGGLVPYGANYAVRTQEQRQALYDPQLGVSPSHKMLGEEVDVMYRMFKAGVTGWWVPGSLVNHIIPPARQTRSYVYEYYFLAGATMVHMRQHHPRGNFLVTPTYTPPGYSLGAFRCFRRGVNRLLQFRRARRAGDPIWVSLLADAGYYMGAASYRNRLAPFLLNLKTRV